MIDPCLVVCLWCVLALGIVAGAAVLLSHLIGDGER